MHRILLAALDCPPRFLGARAAGQWSSHGAECSRLCSMSLGRARPQPDGAKSCKPLGEEGRKLAELRALFRCAESFRRHLGRPLARCLVDRSCPHGAAQRDALQGIKDSRVRADLLAFLKETTKPGAVPKRTAENRMNGKSGMMGGGRIPNLKNPDPAQHVTGITHCRDTYRVTTADGKTRHFWERNLRLKTDSSKDGPQSGTPALLPAGMMGDRADVIFAEPAEISKMIEARC